MRRAVCTLSTITLALAGCAGSGASGSPGSVGRAAPLAYAMPAAASVSYRVSDSTRLTIETPAMSAAETEVTQSGTLELAFARMEAAERPVRVTVRFDAFSGRLSSSVAGEQTIGNEQVGGAIVAELGARGGLEIVERPPVNALAMQGVSPANLLEAIFQQLPGRPVESGASWTDTIRASTDREGFQVERERVVTATLVGDTLVDGSTFRVIRSSEAVSMTVEGSAQGTEVVQVVYGTVDATTVWDPGRRLVVERSEESRLQGTLDMPSAGVSGVPIESRSLRTAVLIAP